MSEYTKIETARSIICDMCECLYPDGYCPEKCDLEKCDWMEYLKEDAANVAPVVHGRWIRPHWKNSNYCCDCSECGGEAMHRDYQWDKNSIYPICPNRGARMDGDDDAKES